MTNSSTSPITIGTLTNGREYVCTVTPITGLGAFPQSTPVTATPYAVPPPPAPTITAIEPEDSGLLVRFTPGDDGGSPITDYTVTCGGISAGGPDSPITVTGLTNGQEYSCSVVATNSEGSSPPSESVSGTPNIVDSDRDGLSDQEEIDIGTDPFDPDTDGDGIMDGLDREPLVASNLCSGDNAILDYQTITSQATCAANNSITVESTVAVDSTGDLELIAPSVSLKPGFGVAGQLSVQALSPMPPPE